MHVRRALVLLLALAAGCGRVAFDPTRDGSDASTSDAAAAPDADGSAGAATTYSDFTDPTAWSTFDITTVTPMAAGFTGAAFDGRYIYFVPSYNGTFTGIVARYDTQASFTSAAAWTTFDTHTINAVAGGFDGAVFDGAYVYFVPHENSSGFDGVVARYDTRLAFTSDAAWQTFDTATVAPLARGFYGARFDGRYVYLVPYYSQILTRYDTQAPFTAPASWTTFDLTTVSANAPAFIGAVFDGRYLYFPPFSDSTATSGLVLRYDTQAPLTVPASWTTFDTLAIGPTLKGYAGATFDGRYIYLVPFAGMPGYSGTVVRYDITAPFSTSSSWQAFDAMSLSANAKGLFGGTFDGRYMYFAPYGGTASARYDTTGSFTDPAAWSVFEPKSIAPAAALFYGAVFDGSAVYLVPHGGSTVARFAAKSPLSLPQLPGFDGSFL